MHAQDVVQHPPTPNLVRGLLTSSWMCIMHALIFHHGKMLRDAIISQTFPYQHQICDMESGQRNVAAEQAEQPRFIPSLLLCSYVLKCNANVKCNALLCILIGVISELQYIYIRASLNSAQTMSICNGHKCTLRIINTQMVARKYL